MRFYRYNFSAGRPICLFFCAITRKALRRARAFFCSVPRYGRVRDFSTTYAVADAIALLAALAETAVPSGTTRARVAAVRLAAAATAATVVI